MENEKEDSQMDPHTHILRRDDYECSACGFLADRYFTACPRCSASLEHAEYEA